MEIQLQAFLTWKPHSRCGGCGKRAHLLTQPTIELRLLSRVLGSVVTIQTELHLKTVTAKQNSIISTLEQFVMYFCHSSLTLILRRSRTGTVWFYTSTSNKRAARPKLYTKSLIRDLKRMYSRLTLVTISINLQAPCVLYIRTGVSLLFRERFLYI